MTLPNLHFYRLYTLVLPMLGGLILLLIMMDPATQTRLIREDGPIELLSAINYFLCAGLIIYFKDKDCKSCAWVLFVLLVLGLRELDFHTRFTTMGMMKIKFYLSPDVPIVEKLVAGAFMLLALYALFLLYRRHFRELWQALIKREPYAIGVVLGILFAVVSKSLDGLKRKLKGFDIELADNANAVAHVMEEVLEFGIGLMFMIAIVAYFLGQRQPRTDRTS